MGLTIKRTATSIYDRSILLQYANSPNNGENTVRPGADATSGQYYSTWEAESTWYRRFGRKSDRCIVQACFQPAALLDHGKGSAKENCRAKEIQKSFDKRIVLRTGTVRPIE